MLCHSMNPNHSNTNYIPYGGVSQSVSICYGSYYVLLEDVMR